jgi:hypothetical protein
LAKPDVATFGDHEVITPDTRHLRKTLRPAQADEDDPVARAEAALAEISTEFVTWMHNECDRLDAARHKIKETGLSKETKTELYLAAHDIKGNSDTFGFAAVGPAADSLCRLLEYSPEPSNIPLSLIDQHVDSVRAIVREYSRGDIGLIASVLTGKLRTVTDEFLVHENRDRPEVLRTIQNPAFPHIESF